MKAIAFGDLHAHLFTDFADVDEITGNSRFTQIISTLEYMRNFCIDNGIKLALFAGDLFHKRVTVNTTVFNAMYEQMRLFSDKGITVVMTVGNHDQVDNSDYPEHSLKAFDEIENVFVLDRFEHKWFQFQDNGDIKSIGVFPAPYSKNAQLVKDAIEQYAQLTTKEGIEKKSVLLGHLGISGAYIGKGNYAMADAFSVEDLFPHAFAFGVFGHFHKRQYLGGHKHFFYTGAPIQHSFNDEGEEKGFMILDFDTGEATFEPIPSPMFITVTNYKEVDMNDLKGNFIRFQVNSDDVEDLLSKIPDGLKYRLEVQKVYKEEKRVDVDVSMSFADIIKTYAKEFKPEAEQTGLDIWREVEQS